jgi:hypothetical protein
MKEDRLDPGVFTWALDLGTQPKSSDHEKAAPKAK